jgi:hypothetical protein
VHENSEKEIQGLRAQFAQETARLRHEQADEANKRVLQERLQRWNITPPKPDESKSRFGTRQTCHMRVHGTEETRLVRMSGGDENVGRLQKERSV